MTTAKTKETATAAKAVEETVAATKDTVEKAVKAGQDAVAKNVEQMLTMSKEQFDKAGGTVFKGFEDFAAYGKDNVDAWVAAGTIVSEGWQDLGKAWFALTKTTMDNGIATAQAMMTAKSARELVDLQSSYAKSTFDKFVAEGTKLSEMGVKVTNDAMEPLSARVNATVEKFAKPLAA